MIRWGQRRRRGMFGSHGLEADPVSVREDTEQVRFDLSGLPKRE